VVVVVVQVLGQANTNLFKSNTFVILDSTQHFCSILNSSCCILWIFFLLLLFIFYIFYIITVVNISISIISLFLFTIIMSIT